MCWEYGKGGGRVGGEGRAILQVRRVCGGQVRSRTCALSHPWEGVHPRTSGLKPLPYSLDEQSCTGSGAKAGAAPKDARLTPCCGIGVGGCSAAAPLGCPFFAPGLKTPAFWLKAKVFSPTSALAKGLRDARFLKTQVRSPDCTSWSSCCRGSTKADGEETATGSAARIMEGSAACRVRKGQAAVPGWGSIV